MVLRIIIIDDEPDAIEAIESIVEINNTEYQIVAKTTDPAKGLELILLHKPDVVFLDIEMPGMNGFQLLDKISNIDFDVIFATAYEHYAIRAIKLNALDYILKPVSITEVMNALEKAKKRKQTPQDRSVNYKNLLSDIKSPRFQRIKISTVKGFEFVVIDNIIRLEAEGSYTKMYLKDQEKILVSKPIKKMEEELSGTGFFKSHRSHVINLNHIRSYNSKKSTITMTDESIVPLSRRKQSSFSLLMEEFCK